MSFLHFTFTAMFMLGLLGLTFHRVRLLSLLLCLEVMMLALFISLSLWALKFSAMTFLAAPMMLITLSACEASTGLTLLAATFRTHGTDHTQNISILKC